MTSQRKWIRKSTVVLSALPLIVTLPLTFAMLSPGSDFAGAIISGILAKVLVLIVPICLLVAVAGILVNLRSPRWCMAGSLAALVHSLALLSLFDQRIRLIAGINIAVGFGFVMVFAIMLRPRGEDVEVPTRAIDGD